MPKNVQKLKQDEFKDFQAFLCILKNFHGLDSFKDTQVLCADSSDHKLRIHIANSLFNIQIPRDI